MKIEKVRVGMIGTGGISHWHVKQLMELDDAIISAVTVPIQRTRKNHLGI